MRQQMLDRIREQFARFGDEVCTLITTAALRPNGMPELLARLGIQPASRFESQLLALTRYLAALGTTQFLAMANPKFRKEQGAARPAAAPLSPVIAAALDETKRVKAFTPAPQGDATAVTPAPTAAEHPVDTPPHWFDNYGRYIGPERRVSGERRRGQDRRDRVDAIPRNHRYGGDRRKQRRRSTDV